MEKKGKKPCRIIKHNRSDANNQFTTSASNLLSFYDVFFFFFFKGAT